MASGLCSASAEIPPHNRSLSAASVSHQTHGAPPTLTAVQLWGVCLCVCVEDFFSCTVQNVICRKRRREESNHSHINNVEEVQRSC